LRSVRFLLPDKAWADLAPLLATWKSRAGRPPVRRARLVIEAVLYRARTGLPWHDLPKDFGRWDAGYNRWRRLWEHLQTEAGPIPCPRFREATMVRAPQHAAGA
jgi:transposase